MLKTIASKMKRTKEKNSQFLFTFQLPPNNALGGLCDAMIEAWKLKESPNAAILFIIENVSYNICDQVSEYAAYNDYKQWNLCLNIC